MRKVGFREWITWSKGIHLPHQRTDQRMWLWIPAPSHALMKGKNTRRINVYVYPYLTWVVRNEGIKWQFLYLYIYILYSSPVIIEFVWLALSNERRGPALPYKGKKTNKYSIFKKLSTLKNTWTQKTEYRNCKAKIMHFILIFSRRKKSNHFNISANEDSSSSQRGYHINSS